jgi:EAL domain-containing protein (putative c-di-GMP-specific phosphodiesterase class I)
VVTAEALLRPPHADVPDGSLTPEVLLSAAKKAGLLGELDRWVLRTALREAATWPESVAVSVNLAGLRPDEPGFADTIIETLDSYGVDGRRLVLEMVESVFVDLPTGPRKTMANLHDRGIRFAMDDFGTGYSSLARLKELPTQIIKLDRQFVAGLDDDADMGIARAIVGVAEAMDRYCIAEGVETATQFQRLRNLGVNAYQGWLFSRDLPAQDLRTLLAQKRLPTPKQGASA